MTTTEAKKQRIAVTYWDTAAVFLVVIYSKVFLVVPCN